MLKNILNRNPPFGGTVMHEENSETTCYPALDKGNVEIDRSIKVRNKILAIGIIAIMVISAFAMLTPSRSYDSDLDEQPVPAGIEYGGDRETTYTISDMFQSYMKSRDYADLGRTNGTSGLNEWWDFRESGYGELIIRDTYPYIIASPPGPASYDVDPGFYTYAPYRLEVEASNVSDMGTATGKDTYFLPFLGNPNQDGGWVNISWYGTYLYSQDISDIRNRGVAHYANTYYDLFYRDMPNIANDGWWHELMGEMNFTRQAAKKFLGLPGTGDLRTEYAAVDGDVEADWMDEWLADGGGQYDTYTNYEYSDDIRVMRISMDYDNSTADLLQLRFYSISWGNEMLLTRYLEAGNITPSWQGYMEDMWLNMTIGPDMADVYLSGIFLYQMLAWKDPDAFKGAWSMEALHSDYIPNRAPLHLGYPSPYNDYNPATTNLMRPSYNVGTTQFGNNVSYWITPMILNLTDGERMIFRLPSTSVYAFEPYRGASDTLDAAKQTEMLSYGYWGEMVLGSCTPDMASNYDAANKTLTLNGPFDAWAARVPNQGDTSLIEQGSPMFVFTVSEVSDYDVEIVEPPETGGYYRIGVDYTLRVTAKDLSGSTVTDWNGTVIITTNDTLATLGGGSNSITHTFQASENGVWETTINFGTVGWWAVDAADENFTLDVTGGLATEVVYADIPEFAVLIIPILGAVAIFLVLRTKKRRE